jgi:Cys-rich repeat protein
MSSTAKRATLLLGLLAACALPVVGAPCDNDSQCPDGQYCSAGKCKEGKAPPRADASVRPDAASDADGGTATDAG